MTKKPSDLSAKIEDMPLWKEACGLAEYMYSKLHEFPDEEKWATAHKIRSSANDMMFVVAQALGSTSPSGSEYEWGQAGKHVAALKTMYRFAGRQHFIELEPSIMVRLDAASKLIDAEVAAAHQKAKALNQEEMNNWRTKYGMWQQMNTEEKGKPA